MNICCDLPALCHHVVEVLVMWEESRVSHSLSHWSHVTDHMTLLYPVEDFSCEETAVAHSCG